MQRTSMAVVLAVTSFLAAGCAAKGGDDGGGGGEPDPAFLSMAACASTRMQDFGEFLRAGYTCLHAIDTNAGHLGCSWVPCRPEPPGTCPAAGTFEFEAGFAMIAGTVRSGLRSECWNGMGTNETCPFEWHTVSPSAVAGSGDMGFVELSPERHLLTLANAGPVLEANACRLEITNLGVYLLLSNVDMRDPVKYPVVDNGQVMFEVTNKGEVLTGTALFGHSGTAPVDLIFRGATRRCVLDVTTFVITC